MLQYAREHVHGNMQQSAGRQGACSSLSKVAVHFGAVLLSGRAVAGPLAIHEPSRSIIPFTVHTTHGSVVHTVLTLAGYCQVHHMLKTISHVRHSYLCSLRQSHPAPCAASRWRNRGFVAATIVMLHLSCARLCQPQPSVEGIHCQHGMSFMDTSQTLLTTAPHRLGT